MPKSVKPSDMPARPVEKGTTAYARDIERARSEGVVEGRAQARHELLTFLQEKYMDVEDTRTVEAKAILELTRVTSQFLHTGKRR